MKFVARNVIIVACIAVVLGCSAKKEPPSSKVVEDFTGVSTIKKGEAMKNKIKQIENIMEEREKKVDSIQ